MLEPMILSKEQQEAVDYMMSTRQDGGCAMASEVGTGKTLVSVEFCRAYKAKVILIIAPLQTRGDADAGGWHGTFEQQQYGLPFRHIANDKEGWKALDDYEWKVPGIYFIGQEYFVRLGWKNVPQLSRDGTQKHDHNGKPIIKKIRTPLWGLVVPDVVIFDEVHRAQNGDSLTVKTLMGGVQGKGGLDASYKIGASGTITGNSFDGAWAVTRWLWPQLVDASIYVWREKWAEIEYDHFAVRNQKVVGEKVPGAFFNSLPCYIRIESDLKIEIDEQNIQVDISPEQRRVYNELDTLSVAWIKDHPMIATYPITIRVRQRQATLGFPSLFTNSKGETIVGFDVGCESAKIDRMWSILENDFENETALIFTDSQIFADVIVHRLNKRYGEDSARKWSGKVSQKLRAVNKADYIAGQFKYMVAVITATGTGTDSLQFATRNLLYFSSDDSRIENEQSIGRVIRRGQKSELVRIRRLIATDTIDTGQLSTQMAAAIQMNKSLKKRRK